MKALCFMFILLHLLLCGCSSLAYKKYACEREVPLHKAAGYIFKIGDCAFSKYISKPGTTIGALSGGLIWRLRFTVKIEIRHMRLCMTLHAHTIVMSRPFRPLRIC